MVRRREEKDKQLEGGGSLFRRGSGRGRRKMDSKKLEDLYLVRLDFIG